VTGQPSQTIASAVNPAGWLPAFRLNLEQQRKRAKDLQRALADNDPDALSRFRRHHPHGAAIIDRQDVGRLTRLSEAQLVIARELGLPSWPKLRGHILSMQRVSEAIAASGPPADGALHTLHIRCGSDIRPVLAEGGFAGDFLEYSDPFCVGPVVDGPDWQQRRAAFLAENFSADVGRSAAEIAAGLARAEATLQSAAQTYDRIVLWFEHDGYDQLILARCLAQFAATPPRRLEMVSVDRFPGSMRFIGFGQLPPEALRLLWEQRRPVSARQCEAGGLVWTMLRAPDPSPLAAAAREGIPELPFLAAAVRRHCQELPWVRDGLSLTEQLILRLLSERPMRIGEIFRDLMEQRDPLPFLTDLILRRIVLAMQRTSRPVFTGVVDPGEPRWYRETLRACQVSTALT
jgi:hypothetical protein